MSSKRSFMGGGGKRVTNRHKDGSTTSWDYNKYGRAVSVVDTDKHGRSHAHNVGRGIFGPFKGSRRK